MPNIGLETVMAKAVKLYYTQLQPTAYSLQSTPFSQQSAANGQQSTADCL